MIKLSASLICADPINLIDDINALENGNIDQIHFDVMDGIFVPRFGLYPEILQELKKVSKKPVDVHLMIDDPEKYVDIYASSGADYIVFHEEATKHSGRIIHKIKSLGIKAGMALNPGTPIHTITDLIQDIDILCLMAIDPGILGGKFYNNIYTKICEAKNKNPNLEIQIDGGVKPETIPLMINAGANNLVCGTGTIFRKHEDTIENKIKYIKSILNNI
jgi:ribulose-phosphate 3-epimerase